MQTTASMPPASNRDFLLGLLRCMRISQWVKNGFIFAPLVFAAHFDRVDEWGRSGFAFLCFSFAASAVYVFNDWVDAEADREHPVKRHRPLASRTLPASLAAAAIVVLALAALAGAYVISPVVMLLIGAYLVVNVAYTYRLKHVVILDIFVIASGFLLRVETGAIASNIVPSTWLLVCTTMLALFLGFSKRRHELMFEAQATRRVLGEYSLAFLDQMMSVVTATTVFSYIMYAVSPETEARVGRWMLLTVPFVFYGIFRYQYLIYHKNSAQNPTDALLTDRPLVLTVVFWLITAAMIVKHAHP